MFEYRSNSSFYTKGYTVVAEDITTEIARIAGLTGFDIDEELPRGVEVHIFIPDDPACWIVVTSETVRLKKPNDAREKLTSTSGLSEAWERRGRTSLSLPEVLTTL